MLVPEPQKVWKHREQPNWKTLQAELTVPLRFLMNPPMAKVRRVGVLTVPNNTPTAVTFNQEDIDTDNMFTSSQPTRLTPKAPGWYVGTFGVGFMVGANGYRDIYVRKNADSSNLPARTMFHPAVNGATSNNHGIPFIEQFNGGTDYLELVVWHNEGSSLELGWDFREREVELSLKWIARL